MKCQYPILNMDTLHGILYTVYPIKYAQWCALFSFVWVTKYFVVDLYNRLTHILQDCFTGTGAIMWLPQCQWSNPEKYGWNQLVLDHNKTLIVTYWHMPPRIWVNNASGNGLLPVWHQATSEPMLAYIVNCTFSNKLHCNLNQNIINFHSRKMHLNMLSAKCLAHIKVTS